MRLVGGALALDFLNTRVGPPEGPPTDDVLVNYADVLAWARYAGALDAQAAQALTVVARQSPSSAEQTWERLLAARDTLDGIFRRIAAGRAPEEAALDRLARDEADAVAGGKLVPTPANGHGAYAWSWVDDRSLLRPLREVVHSATYVLQTAPLARLKACAGCSFVFLDESKNRSRRWCSMDDCGTAQKVRRYVAARRARSARAAGD